jgi:hypothetical protein
MARWNKRFSLSRSIAPALPERSISCFSFNQYLLASCTYYVHRRKERGRPLVSAGAPRALLWRQRPGGAQEETGSLTATDLIAQVVRHASRNSLGEEGEGNDGEGLDCERRAAGRLGYRGERGRRTACLIAAYPPSALQQGLPQTHRPPPRRPTCAGVEQGVE